MSLRDDTCAYQLGGNWTKVAEDGNQFGVLNNSFGDWEKKTNWLSINQNISNIIDHPAKAAKDVFILELIGKLILFL